MKWIGACLLFLTSLTQAQAAPDERARWEEWQASEHRFRASMFTRAGFAPIEEVQAGGRQVRRLLLSDPYMMLPVPGIELERHADERVTLRLQYYGWSSDPVPVDRGAWDTLASIERPVFAVPAYVPAPASASPPPPPPPVCHGWAIWLQGDAGRSAAWSGCGRQLGPAYDYAMHIVVLAMGTRPSCNVERDNPFWSFNRCFAPTDSLDDPTLEATYAILRSEYYGAPGADRLAEARRALQAPALSIGSPAWQSARAAIARVKEVHDYREARLSRLRQLAAGAPNASPADRAKMRQAIEAWSQFLQAQQRNYADLLERLASVGD
jgi:hypothetical protein